MPEPQPACRESGTDAAPLLDPPRRKTACPIIDAHLHFGSVEDTGLLVDVARRYGLTRLLGIVKTRDQALILRRRYGDLLGFLIRPTYELIGEPTTFREYAVELLNRSADEGLVGVKFWFKPPFLASSGVTLDDPRMAPIWETMDRRRLVGLAHIADPDAWFVEKYGDVEKYGTKLDQYTQLTNVLERYPDVSIIGAHFGGNPEDLEFLAGLLTRYPNFHIDTSATKWVARELSAKPREARDFVVRFADKIIFGTDLVVSEKAEPDYYASRFWVQQMLWEGCAVLPSPIPDPDHPAVPIVHGLCLEPDVLERIYHKNAERVFRLDA